MTFGGTAALGFVLWKKYLKPVGCTTGCHPTEDALYNSQWLLKGKTSLYIYIYIAHFTHRGTSVCFIKSRWDSRTYKIYIKGCAPSPAYQWESSPCQLNKSWQKNKFFNFKAVLALKELCTGLLLGAIPCFSSCVLWAALHSLSVYLIHDP